MPRATRARRAQLVTILWRDIPAQVNAQSAGGASGASDKHQQILKPRFQKAIDRAAMVAGITSASDYVQEWRRVTIALDADADPAEAAATEAARLDEAFPLSRLDELVATGGWDPDSPNDPTPNDPTANEESTS